MSHASMLKTRRAKQRTRKDLAGIAKHAKKAKREEIKAAAADAAKKQSH